MFESLGQKTSSSVTFTEGESVQSASHNYNQERNKPKMETKS
jgi:hypothetical protein